MERIAIATNLFPVAPEGIYFEANHAGLEPTYGLTMQPQPGICNGMPGRQLALWLQAALIKCGDAPGEPIQEDYGWCFTIDNARPKTTVYVSGDETFRKESKGAPGWLVSIEEDASFNDDSQSIAIEQQLTNAQGVSKVLKNAFLAEGSIKVIKIWQD